MVISIKNILGISFVILTLSLVFLGYKNTSNCLAANAPSNAIKLTDKTFAKKSFKFTIPQISGMGNKQIQTLANNNIKKELLSQVDDTLPKSSLTGDSKIIFQNNKLLVFQYDGLYIWPEGPHPAKINQGINIDLNTGTIYSLNDLFKQNINYKSELKKIIRAHEKQYRFKATGEDFYNAFTYDDFIENLDGVEFVMHRDYLHLYYMGIYAIGTVAGYKIPYNDIKSIINTNGCLWKAFKDLN